MGKVLVVYQSKYGATKKYAEILREEIPCDVVRTPDCRKMDFSRYDTVLFSGGVYAGSIAGLKDMKKHRRDLTGKKLAVLCVGASPSDPKAMKKLREQNLKGEFSETPLFYARGAWDESKMDFKDQLMCKLLEKSISRLDESACEPWMKELLTAVGQKHDWVDRKQIRPLIKFLRG